jgi:hypothetical protein
MSVLAEALVAIGVKGQKVVLTEIDKVKKQADAVNKMKTTVDLGRGVKGSKAMPGKSVPGAPASPQQYEPGPAEKKKSKDEEKSNSKLTAGLKSFGGHVSSFAKAATSLDPVTTMQGITTAAAKIAGGWSAFGFSAQGAAEGLGQLMNAGISMASGAVASAKQSAAEQYGLTTRNATTANFGGDKLWQEGIIGQDENGKNVRGLRMSNSEKAQMVSMISGSFGKIQEPLANELNKLSGKKDTAALSRVGAGDWQSTGTTKGWMIQQMMNGMSGMPPEIAQKFQAEMLKQHGGEIQNKTQDQKWAQATNAGWVSQNEKQTGDLYSAASQHVTALYNLSDKFNKIQIDLVASGATLSVAVNKMAGAVIEAVAKIKGAQAKK